MPGCACDCPSVRPFVGETLSDTAPAHGNSGTCPPVNAGQNGAPVLFPAENPSLSGIEMASGSRLHPGWIIPGLWIGLAGAARVPSPVEHQDRVPRHSPAIAPDLLTWGLRLNWQIWE